jgi:hypothetical protein
MRQFVALRTRLALGAALLLAGAGGAYANSITVPNGTSGPCAAGNPNTARFAGNCGSLVTLADATATFVQDNSPSTEALYRVRFYANARGLTMSSGEFDLFAAYDGADPLPANPGGNAIIRVTLAPNNTTSKILKVYTRLDSTSESATSNITFPDGWRSVELDWAKGASGHLTVWLDGLQVANLTGLSNNSQSINLVRWGANALDAGTTGTFTLDDFVSQRSGYIGPVQAFSDEPIGDDTVFWKWVQGLYQAGITSGCGNGMYCPGNPVLRSEMAIFLERGKHGVTNPPPAATGTVFGDVPSNGFGAAFIEQMFADGITGGCVQGSFPTRQYCPGNSVLRSEMAIFLLRAEHGGSYTPPAATGTVFGDVPANAFGAAFIEQLFAEGVTGGCVSGTFPTRQYCPGSSVNRGQMAVFLTRTFGLPLVNQGP